MVRNRLILKANFSGPAVPVVDQLRYRPARISTLAPRSRFMRWIALNETSNGSAVREKNLWEAADQFHFDLPLVSAGTARGRA